MVTLVASLVKKWHKASEGKATSKGAYEGLSRPRSKELLKKWTKEAEEADTNRGDTLTIYNICQRDGRD